MYKIEDLYACTNQGLVVLVDFFSHEYNLNLKGNDKEHFRVRPEDNTPSCCLVAPDQRTAYWRFMDYGNASMSRPISPVDLYASHHSLSFADALAALAFMYGVPDSNGHQASGAVINWMDAPEGAEKGLKDFEKLPEFSSIHLRTMGATIAKEHLVRLNWIPVKTLRIYVEVPDRNHPGQKKLALMEKSSTTSYPIFIRQCFYDIGGNAPECFYKLYEPLCPDKSRRFLTLGRKPADYINGLYEIRKNVADAKRPTVFVVSEGEEHSNSSEEDLDIKDVPTSHKQQEEHKQKRLPAIAICSGERDSLCCLSRGIPPVWLNSETARMSADMMEQLREVADKIYVIPDIDRTGMARCYDLARRFNSLYAVILPMELKLQKDHRGKPCKDLRDWMEQPGNQDPMAFKAMLKAARTTKFWYKKKAKASEEGEDDVEVTYDIKQINLRFFLSAHGFFTYKDEQNMDIRLTHIDGNIVEEVDDTTIREFVFKWAEALMKPLNLQDRILTTPKLARAALTQMERAHVQFYSYTPNSQFFFFTDKIWEVCKDSIIEHRKNEIVLDQFVWKDDIFNHQVTLLKERFFHVDRILLKGHKTPSYQLHINYDIVRKSPLMCYLLNTSRLHWRKELEYNFKDKDDEERLAYFNAHHFCIDGEGLEPWELKEQQLNFLAKMFAIGYLLHAFKSPSRAWAVYAVDNCKCDAKVSNGRSGKSLLFSLLKKFIPVDIIPAKKKDEVLNPHIFERVKKSCRLLVFDDLNKDLELEDFYSYITSGIIINEKNVKSYALEYEKSPKLVFTTNYAPKEFNASSEGRLLYMTFGDYYHIQSANNSYLESRSVEEDLGFLIGDNLYPEEYWSGDMNFLAQCVQFYLMVTEDKVKLQPPMGNIIERSLKDNVGDSFLEWANMYLAPGSGHLNTQLVRKSVYDDFRAYANVQMSTAAISLKIHNYVQLARHIVQINPREYLNKQGRNIEGNVEYIFFQAVSEDEMPPSDDEEEEPIDSSG